MVGLVALLVALSTLASFKMPTEAGTRPIDDVAIACGLVGALAILLWRVSPYAMFAITTSAMFTYTALDYPGGPALLPGPVMLAVFGYAMPRRTAWVGAVVMFLAFTAGRRIGQEPLGVGELLVLGWSMAAVLAGQAIRARADRLTSERERKAQLERQAIADERLRIAQDLHDSVAHAMATINVQSGVAAHLIDRRPEQARDALEAIRAASAEVLDELGTILGVLREPDEAAPRAPAGRLDDVAALVDRARRDGLAVTFDDSLDPDARSSVPASISTAGFRVVQEALTNTRRHAAPDAIATVRIAIVDEMLVIEANDDGGRHPVPEPDGFAGTATVAANPTGSQALRTTASRPQPNGSGATAAVAADPTGSQRTADGSGGGFGLIGMRERAASSGGTLVAGPRPDGGFRVRATWELDR